MHSVKLAFNKFEDETAKEILPNGYQPKYIQEAINDSLGKERVDVHNSENFMNRRKEIETDLEDFVKQLKQKNIQIVFLTTPVYSTYSKYCDRNIVESNNQFINLLCQKYRCNYLTFFEDTRFTKDDFFDNDHLKNNGAIKLSKIISDTLAKL
jgi:lysophospholipase L1-like esterase